MPRLTRVLSTIALALGVSTTQGMFRFDCHNNLVVDRVDPIVNPGTEGGHVHIVSGGNAFSKDATDLSKSTCTSCPIGADLSAYWTPALYVKFKNGTGYARVKGGQIVYYQPRGDKDEKIYALPNGLKMLAGDVNVRTYNETDIKQRAVTWQCINYANGVPEQPGLPNVRCPQGLRGQVNFPMCWDGVNLDSPDHKSHMAYAEGIDGGKCPPSHPKKVIKVFYEMFFEVAEWDSEWDGDKHPFVLANGDTTGYSFHGDFFGGWDENVLQRATDECRDKNYFNPGECAPLAPTYNSKPPEKRCTLEPQIKEEVNRVTELPMGPMGSMKPSPATSAAPSAAPSTAPGASVAPSVAPSAAPSTAPGASVAPSVAPSAAPSTAPGATPTPSAEVGNDGDYDEDDDDDEEPTPSSAAPSTAPSTKPSAAPSTAPSTKPSAKPSDPSKCKIKYV